MKYHGKMVQELYVRWQFKTKGKNSIENIILYRWRKKKKIEGKSAYVIYPAIAMPFTYPQSRKKKKEEKRTTAEWPVKIAGATAAVPNNQIRPYFPGPQLQYRPWPPLNSKKTRLARSVSQKAKKGGKTRQPRERGRRERSGERNPAKNEEKRSKARTRGIHPPSSLFCPPPLPSFSAYLPRPPYAPTLRRWMKNM